MASRPLRLEGLASPQPARRLRSADGKYAEEVAWDARCAWWRTGQRAVAQLQALGYRVVLEPVAA